MPFKSEAQRRYLWANEPEIARDWADTYGSRVQKNNGGIMHNFANYAHDDGSNVSVPRSFQARPHSDQVNLAYITPEEQGILQALKPGTPHRGPMEIPNYDSFDAAGNYSSGAAMSAAETGGKTDRDRRDMAAAGISPQQAQDIRSGAIASGAGQTVNPGFFEPRHRPGISKQDLGAAKAFAPNAYRATRGSPFGIGNLFRGAMSMFGGWPGRIGSFASGLGDKFSQYGKTRDYWTKEAVDKRRYQKRLDDLYRRKNLGKGFSQDNIDMIEAMGFSPYTAQNVDSGRSSGIRGEEPVNLNKIYDPSSSLYEDFTDDIALSKQMSSLQSDAIPYEEFGIATLPTDEDLTDEEIAIMRGYES